MVAVQTKVIGDGLKSMGEAIRRAQDVLGKTPKNAISWAGALVCRSLVARTIQSPKLRKIVPNPAFKGKGGAARKRDMRRARFGVMKYRPQSDEQYFLPIYRGGEYGAKIKYISRDKVLLKVGSNWVPYDAGREEWQAKGIMDHPKRKIGRSGLAKKSWSWAQRSTRKGGTATIMGAPQAVEIKWNNSKDAPRLKITNNLRYIIHALRGGKSAVNEALLAASSAMKKRIEQELAKAIKA